MNKALQFQDTFLNRPGGNLNNRITVEWHERKYHFQILYVIVSALLLFYPQNDRTFGYLYPSAESSYLKSAVRKI